MAFIRLLVFGFIGLSIVYLAVSLYSRSVRREKLENEWRERHPEDEGSADREAFIEAGLEAYQNGLRRKLILLVYIIPTIVVVGILIATNWN